MANEHEILEQSRRAAIRSAATLLDSVSKAKQLRRRFATTFGGYRRRAEGDEKDSGDFLFDLVRLNAEYLNRVSRLGERYSEFAHRMLENFYAVAAPPSARRDGRELVFDFRGSEQAKMSRRFVVESDLETAATVTIEWPWLTGRQDGEWVQRTGVRVEVDAAFQPEVSHARRRWGLSFDLAPGRAMDVSVVVDRSEGQGFLRRRYEFELVVCVSEKEGRWQVRERRVPVSIDLRTPKRTDHG